MKPAPRFHLPSFLTGLCWMAAGLFAAASLTLSSRAQPGADGLGTIEGRIFNAATGSAVANVAIDEYGDRGDENIGEFLRFLPGVALNDSGHVPNEVTLRGFPSTTSSVTIDGGDVMGARGGDTRTVSLLEVPTGNLSRVEVTKVPTPDMPASGLGGSLNIISKGGFEAKKPAFSYQLYP